MEAEFDALFVRFCQYQGVVYTASVETLMGGCCHGMCGQPCDGSCWSPQFSLTCCGIVGEGLMGLRKIFPPSEFLSLVLDNGRQQSFMYNFYAAT